MELNSLTNRQAKIYSLQGKMNSDNYKLTLRAAYQTALFSFVLICFLLSSAVSADELEITPVDKLQVERTRLKTIEREIDQIASQVNEFKTREYSLLEEVEKYQLMNNLRDVELKGINQKLKTIQLEIENIENDTDILRLRIGDTLKYLRVRMRILYKMGELNNLRMLLSLNNPSEIKKGMWYLSRLTNEDRKKILLLESDYKKMNVQLDMFKVKKRDILSLRKLATKKRKQIGAILTGKKSLLSQIQTTREKRQEAITELKNATKQLKIFINKISTGDLDAELILNMDIRKFRGLLDPPVIAPLLKGFGDEIHPVFNIKIPHNGLTYSTKTGTKVKSIFTGKIIYCKRFRGYGNLVIVDHGNGAVTFYTHLLKPLVKVGEFIEKNKVIGLSGESGSLEGPKLYFELLSDGKPVNPVLWFKK